jgi:hypothetical protein
VPVRAIAGGLLKEAKLITTYMEHLKSLNQEGALPLTPLSSRMLDVLLDGLRQREGLQNVTLAELHSLSVCANGHPVNLSDDCCKHALSCGEKLMLGKDGEDWCGLILADPREHGDDDDEDESIPLGRKRKQKASRVAGSDDNSDDDFEYSQDDGELYTKGKPHRSADNRRCSPDLLAETCSMVSCDCCSGERLSNGYVQLRTSCKGDPCDAQVVRFGMPSQKGTKALGQKGAQTLGKSSAERLLHTHLHTHAVDELAGVHILLRALYSLKAIATGKKGEKTGTCIVLGENAQALGLPKLSQSAHASSSAAGLAGVAQPTAGTPSQSTAGSSDAHVPPMSLGTLLEELRKALTKKTELETQLQSLPHVTGTAGQGTSTGDTSRRAEMDEIVSLIAQLTHQVQCALPVQNQGKNMASSAGSDVQNGRAGSQVTSPRAILAQRAFELLGGIDCINLLKDVNNWNVPLGRAMQYSAMCKFVRQLQHRAALLDGSQVMAFWVQPQIVGDHNVGISHMSASAVNRAMWRAGGVGNIYICPPQSSTFAHMFVCSGCAGGSTRSCPLGEKCMRSVELYLADLFDAVAKGNQRLSLADWCTQQKLGQEAKKTSGAKSGQKRSRRFDGLAGDGTGGGFRSGLGIFELDRGAGGAGLAAGVEACAVDARKGVSATDHRHPQTSDQPEAANVAQAKISELEAALHAARAKISELEAANEALRRASAG